MTDEIKAGLLHESLDRASMLASVWDQYVLNSPAVQETHELAVAATKACDAMHDCYQAIGHALFDAKKDGQVEEQQ